MVKRYYGGVISATQAVANATSATGFFNVTQQMQAIKAGAWPLGSSAPGVIGVAYGGGYYAGQISTAGNGVADYNLVVGPKATAQSTLQWKTTDTTTAGTDSRIDGPTNSANMNNSSHPAAQFCEGLTIGGFSDWYMPALYELAVCYYNLKPTTNLNSTSSGINPNAVPARASNYTGDTPAQTSAADFKNTGTEYFSGYYLCSTQLGGSNYGIVWDITFTNGGQGYNPKTGAEPVRAIRRVAV